MELMGFAKEAARSVAEYAASFRLGQTMLRQVDRALWVVEQCARWAVPPPLDQDEPQPELVRPLPWVFFLVLIVALRITRESVSLVNLVLGKPPLRSADVVTYIQSKRRYLRTLKYQGTRIHRARAPTATEPWYSSIQTLLQFTMCFRRQSNYGNNNTTSIINNEEVLVVKRKRTRESAVTSGGGDADTMERLIERMMVDLDADSDDDSSFTLTNATSIRSDGSEDSSDRELQNDSNSKLNATLTESQIDNDESIESSAVTSSTPEKAEPKTEPEKENGNTEIVFKDKSSLSQPYDVKNNEEAIKIDKPNSSPKAASNKFIQNEKCSPQKQTRNAKIANGRALSGSGKKKGLTQRRSPDASRNASMDNSV